MARFVQMVVRTGMALSAVSTPSRVHADITLLAAAQRRTRVYDLIGIADVPPEAWQDSTTGWLTVRTLPGDHYTLYSDPTNFRRLVDALDGIYGDGTVPAR
jgi:hypothetical protein